MTLNLKNRAVAHDDKIHIRLNILFLHRLSKINRFSIIIEKKDTYLALEVFPHHLEIAYFCPEIRT